MLWQFAFMVESEWKKEKGESEGLLWDEKVGFYFERNGKPLEGRWSQNSFQLLDSCNGSIVGRNP